MGRLGKRQAALRRRAATDATARAITAYARLRFVARPPRRPTLFDLPEADANRIFPPFRLARSISLIRVCQRNAVLGDVDGVFGQVEGVARANKRTPNNFWG